MDGQTYDSAAGVPGLNVPQRKDVAQYLRDARSLIGQAVQGLTPPEPGRPPVSVSFDLNRYLNTRGRLKSLFWQKL